MDMLEVEGVRIPQGYYFHKGHTWAKIEAGTSVLVGIDDFALRLLGPGDSIEAPLLGKELKQEEPVISLKRGVNIARFLSPVTGIVTGTNQKLREQGSLASQKPYSDGWVLKVQAENLRSDLKNLMINKETEKYMNKEVDLLHKFIEEQAGPLTPDGGIFEEGIFGKIPEISWQKIVSTFLHT
jgi:glycine cleavage system H lipoate-binding protein